MSIFKSFLALILAVTFALGGYFFSGSSFVSIKEMRQMDRIPTTTIASLLGGEAKINGHVQFYRDILDKASFVTSTYTHTPCVYYYYTYEVYEKDADGKGHWVTKSQSNDKTNFILQDESGQIFINTENGSIEWNVPVSFTKTIGNERFTERRIEPRAKLFIFAWADMRAEQASIIFNALGKYTPIISAYGEAYEHRSFGISAIFKLWLGISFITIAVLSIIVLFSIHRLLVFTGVTVLVFMLITSFMGFALITSDVLESSKRYQVQLTQSEKLISKILEKYSYSWPGWENLGEFNENNYAFIPIIERQRLMNIRVNLKLAHHQLLFNQQQPEKLIAAILGASDRLFDVTLAPNEQLLFERQVNQIKTLPLDPLITKVIVLFGLFMVVIVTYVGIKQVKLKRMIENLPTSKVEGVVSGLTELLGRIELCTDPQNENEEIVLNTPISDTPCVWYRYKHSRKEGKNYKVITDNTQQVDFYFEDNTGQILVEPLGAEFITNRYTKKKQFNDIYEEWFIHISDPIYLLGPSKYQGGKAKLVITKGRDDEPFILTNLSEFNLMLKKAWRGMSMIGLGFSCFTLTCLLMFCADGNFEPFSFFLAASLAPVFLVFITLILHFNDLIFLRERARRNRSNIEVSLKKRYDLLPQLEIVVKTYLKHEKNLFTSITNLRESYQIKQPSKQIQQMINQAKQLNNELKLLVEDYPKLKSDKIILDFMNSISSLENEVANMREAYNDAVNIYNTRIQSFPDLILANKFMFKKESLLHYEATMPKVNI